MEESYWFDPSGGKKTTGKNRKSEKEASLKRKRNSNEENERKVSKKQKKEENPKIATMKKEIVVKESISKRKGETLHKKATGSATSSITTEGTINKSSVAVPSKSSTEKNNINQTTPSTRKSTTTTRTKTNNSKTKTKTDQKAKEETRSKKDEKPSKTPNKKEIDGEKKKKKGSKSSSLTATIESSSLDTSSSTNTATTSSTSSSTVQEILEYKHAYEDPNWLGNEDEAGSVGSGVLEEDYCFECGKSTLDCLGDNSVILCDICDGEYHIKCVGLQKLPRSTYVCLRCLEEEERQKQLRYNVSDTFPIPKRKVIDRHVVYSPSRPLEMAWEECVKKGLMTVSRVFSYEIMKYLTHGIIENTTSKGRVVEVWRGATVEIMNRLQSTTCHNLIDREGRFDLKLPNFVVEYLKLDEVLEPMTSRLKTIMGTPTPQIRTHNVVFVPVGSKAQQWHTDDEMKKRKIHRYFTILIQLNSIDSNCGGTEIWVDKLDRGDLVRCRPGDALVFPGSLLHRGQANLGYTHRFFYYASFSCGADMNVGDK